MSQQDEPSVGDEIYIPSQLHVSHGIDDVRGGRTRVTRVEVQLMKGKPTCMVAVEADPGALYNWTSYLGPMQAQLAEEYGEEPARPDPDDRPEFNEP